MTTDTMIPQYNTIIFTDVWSSAEDFKEEYSASALANAISADSQDVLFYLLYAKYGNSPIANRDITQFKYKVYSIIYQYGPTWEKRLDIQKKLRELDETSLLTGSMQIYNHAFNPSSEPSTDSTEALPFISDQNVSNTKRSKLDAYTILWDMLKTDVTDQFLKRFESLFKKFVIPEQTLLYVSEEEEA